MKRGEENGEKRKRWGEEGEGNEERSDGDIEKK